MISWAGFQYPEHSDFNDFVPEPGAYLADSWQGGVRDGNAAAFPAEGWDGSRVATWITLFYNRIHILPYTLDVGAVGGETEFPFYIWNAYFEEQTAESIQQAGLDGISLINLPAVPFTLAPTELINPSLSISPEGPSLIDGYLLIDWSGAPDYRVDVQGQRLAVVFLPMRDGLTEALSWLTTMFQAADGTEQRRMLRRAPRRDYQASYVTLDANQRSRLDNYLTGWRANVWAVPLWHEQEERALVFGQTVIPVTLTPSYFEGGLVAVWASPERIEVKTIESISEADGTITINSPLQNDYPAARVMPAARCYLTAAGLDTNGQAGRARLEFQCIDVVDWPEADDLPQYQGLDVWDQCPLLSSGWLGQQFNQEVNVLDNDTGRVVRRSYWPAARKARALRWHPEDLQAARRMLARWKGRLRPFWAPSYEKDLEVLNAGLIGTALTVRAVGYSSFGGAKDHLAILKADGTWVYRAVTDVSLVGEQETIIVDSDLSLLPADIERVCYLRQWRQDTDRVEIQHRGGLATIATTVTTL